ncbi:WGR domain-containing protein [Ensifer sp. ENS02]|nr:MULTISPECIES: WGR domain-containing protein [Ensifer]MBD9522974.1 WGR domain-containing protein [Ensifer sp. ENS02]UTV41619.1 WGR domain-containing protein [Ensifer adhaerens]
MNRSPVIDSKLSLDLCAPIAESSRMTIVQPYQIYVERRDAARNMARYYSMQISMSLLGEACLTRRWGRIGSHGQMMVHHFAREEEAVKLFLDLTRSKRQRGYRPRM